MVNSRGDAMGVVSRETEAVVLLEALIGSHTERGRGESHDDSPIIALWHINNQNRNAHVQNVNGATKLFWGR